MKKIMISAGEASGDLNGACLARSIKELCPSVELKGIGGSRMKSAGVQIQRGGEKLLENPRSLSGILP
jgi:lipid-A-disaccharide synthase